MPPLLMAHRGGDCFGTENSLVAITSSLEQKSDIIELDIRKSTDGILFCYHGTPFEYLFSKTFFKKSFAQVKRKYPSVITLEEAAQVVGQKSILFLDIKDYGITSAELAALVSSAQVYVAAQNLSYLCKLGSLPNGWKKVCNGGLLLSRGKAEDLSLAGIDLMEIFFWDYTPKVISSFEERNIKVALARWFLPKSVYVKKCMALESAWVWLQLVNDSRKK